MCFTQGTFQYAAQKTKLLACLSRAPAIAKHSRRNQEYESSGTTLSVVHRIVLEFLQIRQFFRGMQPESGP